MKEIIEGRRGVPLPPERLTCEYRCPKCGEDRIGSDFEWYRDVRYKLGWRRFSYCYECAIERSKVYYSEHTEEARAQQARWRREHLDGEEGASLRFWFGRQLGSYRKTSRDSGVPFDLDVDYLSSLYLIQSGECYYTKERLVWTNTEVRPNSMTTMKGALSESEFYAQCSLILKMKDERQ